MQLAAQVVATLRSLRKRVPFLLVIVGTLAVSVGAATSMFSIVNAYLLSSLPYPRAEQLVMLWQVDREEVRAGRGEDLPLSPGGFSDLAREGRSFERLASLVSEEVNVTGAGEPSRMHLLSATGDFFPLLGARASLGRLLGPLDQRPDSSQVLVLSHDYWQRQFGGDRSVIGRKITLGGGPFEVVGVLPADFRFSESLGPVDSRFTRPVDAWAPLVLGDQAGERGFHFLTVVGRLKPGVGVAAARDEILAYSRRAAASFPDTDKAYEVKLVALRDQIFGRLRPVLLTLLAATGFVLLIACANLAALLLARSEAAHRDVAVRISLGASRSRIVGELLLEYLLLSCAGGLLGLLVAAAANRLLLHIAPYNVFHSYAVRTDLRVAAFALGVSILAGLLFGVLPSWRASRVDVSAGMRESSPHVAGSTRLSFFLLVAAEISLATTLLVGAGLSVKSFVGLLRADLGVQKERVLTLNLFLPFNPYRDTSRKVGLFREMLEGIRRLPGVESVGMNYGLPFSGVDPSNGFTIERRPPLAPGEIQSANLGLVNPEYFKTLGIPLLQGRTFRESDTADAPPVAIVDQRMADRFFGAQPALGHRIAIAGDQLLTIIGVVGSVKQDAFEENPRPYVYLPYQQRCYMFTSLAIKASGRDSTLLAPAVRQVIRDLDPNLPVSDVSTLEGSYRNAIAPQRFSLILVSVFAAIALLLTQLGIYGAMNFLTRRRQREAGIRLALGAEPASVFGLVAREGLALSLVGVAVGLGIAIAASRILASLVYGIGGIDLAVFSLVPALTLLATFVAYYRPARALSRVDPIDGLRAE